MDRGIPTEAVLAEMRAAETPTHYLVGTPRGRLSQLEQAFLAKPWAEVREAVRSSWWNRTVNSTSWRAVGPVATRSRRCGAAG